MKKTVLISSVGIAAFIPAVLFCKELGGNTAAVSPATMQNKIEISAGGIEFSVTLHNNPTAASFAELLPLVLNMADLNRNEKYAILPLPLKGHSANPGRIESGDIMLYGPSTIVIFYESFETPYSYVKIGKIDNPAGLKKALGMGDVEVTIRKIM